MNQDVAQLAEMVRQSLKESLQGRKSFREAFGLSEEEITALAGAACEMAEQGRNEEALAMLEGLFVLDPENLHVHNCLGSLYMRLDRRKLAEQEFEYVLARTPDDIAANTNLGELLFEQGELERAVEKLRKAVELDPEGKSLFANRARSILGLIATLAKELQENGPEAMEQLRKQLLSK
ncbi:MAG: tetratricopeptide repeat protein [Acidobacteriota bacterium]|nr:tetratricopeptide repeat protein [Blastocatellia bacterium]MDW8412426.1 tetratricopeptide repeat protein [Acidobacteriota bacterium]